jgi:hypothetical protein
LLSVGFWSLLDSIWENLPESGGGELASGSIRLRSDSGILISSPSGFRSGLHQEKARGDKPAASISLLTHG